MSGALQPLRLATDLVTSAPVQCFHSRYGVNGSIWQQAYWGGQPVVIRQFSPTKASGTADLVLPNTEPSLRGKLPPNEEDLSFTLCSCTSGSRRTGEGSLWSSGSSVPPRQV